MDNNVIEIRGNINSYLNELQRIAAEREEREKKEREEKWKRDEEERKRKAAEFESEHPNMSKYTYASHYNYATFNFDYGGYCKIHFYEWSDVYSEPRIFERYCRLYDFLDKCGIILNRDDDDRIKPLASCYITCKPGSKDLFVCTTYNELKEKVEESKKLATILSSVPDVSSAL